MQDTHHVWEPEAVYEFVGNNCGLATSSKVPTIVVETHDHVFDVWKEQIRRGQIQAPFDVVHIDAHSDLGFGDLSSRYILGELLHSAPCDRQNPKRGGDGGLTEANYLAFAIACRWVRQLTYVLHPKGEDGLPRVLFRDQNPKTLREDAVAPQEQTAGVMATQTTEPSYEAAQPAESHLWDYVHVVLRRRRLVVAVFAAVVGARRPAHAADQARLRGHGPAPHRDARTPTSSTSRASREEEAGYGIDDYYQTQYKLLQSRSLARRVVEQLNLLNDPEFGGPREKEQIEAILAQPPGPEPGRSRARSTASSAAPRVQPIRNSRLVNVSVASGRPELAASATNALAQLYIQQSLDLRFADLVRGGGVAGRADRGAAEEGRGGRPQPPGAQAPGGPRQHRGAPHPPRPAPQGARHRAQRAEDRAAAEGGPLAPDGERPQPRGAARGDAQRPRAEPPHRARQPRAPAGAAPRALPRPAPRGGEGPQPDPGHPRQDPQRGPARHPLGRERLQGRRRPGGERLLRPGVGQAGGAAARRTRAVSYDTQKREVDAARQVLDSLMARAKQTDVASELKSTNIRIVDPAAVPRGPIRPRTVRDIALGHPPRRLPERRPRLLPRVPRQHPQDPGRRAPAPRRAAPGRRPRADRGRAPEPRRPQHRPRPALRRGLPRRPHRPQLLLERARLARSSPSPPPPPARARPSPPSTSPSPSPRRRGGRSSSTPTSASPRRSSSCAARGARASRTSSWARPRPRRPSSRRSRTRTSPTSRAAPTPRAPRTSSPTARCAGLLDGLRKFYDWIIIDTPPVGAVSEPLILAPLTDGVVVVAGAEMVPRKAVLHTLERIHDTGARILGVVLNRAQVDKHSYYYSHYYGHYYGRYYGSQSHKHSGRRSEAASGEEPREERPLMPSGQRRKGAQASDEARALSSRGARSRCGGIRNLCLLLLLPSLSSRAAKTSPPPPTSPRRRPSSTTPSRRSPPAKPRSPSTPSAAATPTAPSRATTGTWATARRADRPPSPRSPTSSSTPRPLHRDHLRGAADVTDDKGDRGTRQPAGHGHRGARAGVDSVSVGRAGRPQPRSGSVEAIGRPFERCARRTSGLCTRGRPR